MRDKRERHSDKECCNKHHHHDKESCNHQWDKSHHPDIQKDYDEFAKELSPDDFE